MERDEDEFYGLSAGPQSRHGRHLNLSLSSDSLDSCLFHELLLEEKKSWSASCDQKTSWSAQTDCHHVWKSDVSQWRVWLNPLWGMNPLLVWKWFLKGEKKHSLEKYGELAHSLERAGPLPRDAGEEMGMEVENEQVEAWESVGKMESERDGGGRVIKEPMRKEKLRVTRSVRLTLDLLNVLRSAQSCQLTCSYSPKSKQFYSYSNCKTTSRISISFQHDMLFVQLESLSETHIWDVIRSWRKSMTYRFRTWNSHHWLVDTGF